MKYQILLGWAGHDKSFKDYKDMLFAIRRQNTHKNTEEKITFENNSEC